MNTKFPIRECRFASTLPDTRITYDQNVWADIDGLSLPFRENESGEFLVTLTIPSTWNDKLTEKGTGFQVVLRQGSSDQTLGVNSRTSPGPFQVGAFSLSCYVAVSGESSSSIVAQWQVPDGPAHIDGLSSLSAVGALTPGKKAFNDKDHWENPLLFSRGLLLSNLSEMLFITGYGPIGPEGKPGDQATSLAADTAKGQMEWIVERLDAFFDTIPYADGTGNYSRYDIVYFDLVVDSSVTADNPVEDNQEQAVLKVLMTWLGSGTDGKQDRVDPMPSTGILKKVAALAVPGMLVEIEFILAH